MLYRMAAATIFALGTCALSTSAYGACSCSTSEGAYSQTESRGVTVLRGNIPSALNPRALARQNAQAAQRRADRAAAMSRAARRSAPASQPAQNFDGRFFEAPRRPSGFRRGKGIQRGFGGVNGIGFGRGFSGRSADGLTFSGPTFSRQVRG